MARASALEARALDELVRFLVVRVDLEDAARQVDGQAGLPQVFRAVGLVEQEAQGQLVLALEQEFKIEIPDEDTEQIKTVKNALDYVKTHVN